MSVTCLNDDRFWRMSATCLNDDYLMNVCHVFEWWLFGECLSRVWMMIIWWMSVTCLNDDRFWRMSVTCLNDDCLVNVCHVFEWWLFDECLSHVWMMIVFDECLSRVWMMILWRMSVTCLNGDHCRSNSREPSLTQRSNGNRGRHCDLATLMTPLWLTLEIWLNIFCSSMTQTSTLSDWSVPIEELGFYE